MKELKEGVLIRKSQGILEVISFYDTVTKTYGLYIYFKNKLVEIIQPLSKEPKRHQMKNPWRYNNRYPWKFDLNGSFPVKERKNSN